MSVFPDIYKEHDPECRCRMCRRTHKDNARKMEKQRMSEELIASAGKASNIPTHPADQYAATCIDIVDLGIIKDEYKGEPRVRHRIILRFFCGEYFEGDKGDQRPLWVDGYFTLSLHENSALRPFLEKWRGQPFTDAELAGFNVAKLVGAPAYLQLSHNVVGPKTYCNIDSVMKLPKGMDAPGVPEGYVRVKDRPTDEVAPVAAAPTPGVPDDDDLPF